MSGAYLFNSNWTKVAFLSYLAYEASCGLQEPIIHIIRRVLSYMDTIVYANIFKFHDSIYGLHKKILLLTIDKETP